MSRGLVIIKYITFTFLTILTTFLTLNMFFEIGVTILEKGVFVMVAIAIEGLKIFTLVRANMLWDKRKIFQACLGYFIYLLVAFTSIVSSLGYTLTTVDKINVVANASSVADDISLNQDKISGLTDKITQNKETIVFDKDQIAEIKKNYQSQIDAEEDPVKKQTLVNQMKNKVDPLNRAIQVLLDANTAALNEKTTTLSANSTLKVTQSKSAAVQQVSANMFKLLGEFLTSMGLRGFTEKTTMFLILVIISLNIELGVILCSPHSNELPKKLPEPTPVPEPTVEPMVIVEPAKKRAPRKPRVKPEAVAIVEPTPVPVPEPEVEPVAPQPEPDFDSLEPPVTPGSVSEMDDNSKKILKHIDLMFVGYETSKELAAIGELADRANISYETAKSTYDYIKFLKLIQFKDNKWIPLADKGTILTVVNNRLKKS